MGAAVLLTQSSFRVAGRDNVCWRASLRSVGSRTGPSTERGWISAADRLRGTSFTIQVSSGAVYLATNRISRSPSPTSRWSMRDTRKRLVQFENFVPHFCMYIGPFIRKVTRVVPLIEPYFVRVWPGEYSLSQINQSALDRT